MKIALLLFFALAAPAFAETISSTYTSVDLKKCKQTQKPDGQVFEGSWNCKGIYGYDVYVEAADAREMVGFGQNGALTCAATKTFNGFNSSGGRIEWRLKDGKPFAAIQRWTVSIDPENAEKHATWLVVNKLDKGFSCHMHYVAGAFPNANAAARKAADARADKFNCEKGNPTFDSNSGPPPITLDDCSGREKF